MAGTLEWNSGARSAASSVNFDSTGAAFTLPPDTQRLEVYCTEAAWYKRGSFAGAVEVWLPINADTWTTIAELDGFSEVAIKAVSTATAVYADAITPRGVRGGR